MLIGELAKSTGVAAHTIRFYESKGLLPKPKRADNGYRHYDTQSAERLALIQFGQGLGFTLEEMTAVFDMGDGCDQPLMLQRLTSRRKEIDALLKQLTEQKRQIDIITQRIESNGKQGIHTPAEELARLVDSLN